MKTKGNLVLRVFITIMFIMGMTVMIAPMAGAGETPEGECGGVTPTITIPYCFEGLDQAYMESQGVECTAANWSVDKITLDFEGTMDISTLDTCECGEYDYYLTCKAASGTCWCTPSAGLLIVECPAPECECYAPDVTICQGDDVLAAIMAADPPASCTGEECAMDIDISGVYNDVPGDYLYTVYCGASVHCDGWVYVLPTCEANAPPITMCEGGDLNAALTAAGAGCSVGCNEVIDTSMVNTESPGTYPYTVTCTDPCGGICGEQTATNNITVTEKVCVEIIEAAGVEKYTNDPLYPCDPCFVGIPNSDWKVSCCPAAETMIVPVSSYFGVKAVIKNCSDCTLYDVTPVVTWTGDLELVSSTNSYNLGNMESGADADCTEVAWTFHCVGEGPTSVTVAVNECSSDTVCFDQREPAELTVECLSDCEVCTDCDLDGFKVSSLVSNIGDTKAVNVTANLTATPGTNVPVSGLVQSIAEILPGDDWAPNWEVECTGEGDVVFTVTVTGTDLCTGDPLVDVCHYTTLQRDVLVDVSAERIDNCNGDTPSDDIVVSVGQYFDVQAVVKHCSHTGNTTEADAKLYLPEGSVIVPGSDVDLYCAAWTPSQNKQVTPTIVDGTATAYIANLCDCCDVYVTYHLICAGPTTGDGSYRVDVTTNTSGLTYSSMPCDPTTVVQQKKADLTVMMEGPFVTDCDCDAMIPVDAVAVDQEYDVKVCVKNKGQADAYDVAVEVKVSGNTSCTATKTIDFGTVEGGTTKCLWLTDTFGTCSCNGESPDVVIKVLSAEAYDDNTCDNAPITPLDNLCDPGLPIPQCDVNVEIINPDTCTDIDEYEVFAVKARINNCGTCEFDNASVTLMMSGNVALDPDSENPVLIDLIEAPDPDCEETCRFEEVTWMVKCMGAGEVTFDVCVETETPHLQIKTDETVTVHQQERDKALVCVEILSPDWGSIYPTSEDFAITAKITNLECCAPIHIDQAKVEVGGMNIFDKNIEVGDPIPAMDWTIGPGQSKIVTWTAHCTGSGLSWFYIHLEGMSDEYEYVYVDSDPVSVWQYPAAHLEVEIIDFPQDPIVTSTVFDVTYTVTNTGEADATDVYATLSVEPEGSVRIAGPSDGGYTQYLGTIPGHGSEASSVSANYTLHCKMPCDSTIKITVEGNDEYGWHMKQQCASTGSFVIENGMEFVDGMFVGMPAPLDLGEQRGFFSGWFIGDANGLFGPFNATSPVSWSTDSGPDFMGEVSLMGSVIPNLSMSTAEMLSQMLCGGPECFWNSDCNCECWCDMLVGKDMMVFTGHIVSDTPYDQLPDFDMFFVQDGLLSIINGQFSGSYMKLGCQSGMWLKTLLGGEYCTNMAATAGLPILEGFIEPDEVTVKQLPMLADLDIDKDVDESNPTMGDTVEFTVTLDNLGPSDATAILVRDLLPDGLSFESAEADQGWYDVTSGYWAVGDLAADDEAVELTITAVVNTVGAVCNQASVYGLDQHDPVTTNNMAEACLNADEPDPVYERTLYLDEGLNLISLPLIPDESDPEVALSGVDFDVIAMYKKDSVDQDFKAYIDGIGVESGFVWKDGKGYWIDMDSSDTLVIDGVEMVSGAVLPPSYHVYGLGDQIDYDSVTLDAFFATSGWNLIGFKSVTAKSPLVYLAGIEGKYVMIYGYDSVNDAFYVVGSPGHTMMEPYHGYWLALKVGESGTIFP